MSSDSDNADSSPVPTGGRPPEGGRPLVLRGMGLSEAEEQVYVAMLKLGARPATAIAKESGFKRGQTYNILAALQEKGFAHQLDREGVKQFAPTPPKRLAKVIDNKMDELRSVSKELKENLPYLEGLQGAYRREPKVRFYRGVEGVRAIYEDTLTVPDQKLYAFTDFATTFPPTKDPVLHDWIWKYSSRRAKQNVTFYGIVNKSPESDEAFRKRSAQKREMKLLTEVSLPVEINVYGDKTAIMSSQNEFFGLIIEDDSIAKTIKSLHNVLWNLLPDYQ